MAKERNDEKGDAEEMMSSMVFATDDGMVLYAGPLTTEYDDEEMVVGTATGEEYTPPAASE